VREYHLPDGPSNTSVILTQYAYVYRHANSIRVWILFDNFGPFDGREHILFEHRNF